MWVFGEESSLNSTSTGSHCCYDVSSTLKMRSSQLSVPAGPSSRCTGSSTIESPARRSKISSTSSKRKKLHEPSTCKSRNKCPPLLYTDLQAAEDSFVHAATNSDLILYPSDYDQATNFPNLPDCQWPNWPEWGSENHEERGGAAGGIGAPSYSDTSSSCSYSDSDCDLRWATSSNGSRAHERREVRKTCSFWEEFIWGERRPWKKLKHKKYFLTNLWDFNRETQVEESSDPILVCVNVLGSPGPLRLVVDKNDSVQDTVDFALRRYSAEKRQPALVDPTTCFGLYCRNPDFEALDDEAKIGHRRNRQFHLYHKQRKDLIMEGIAINDAVSSCKSGGTKKSAPIRTRIWSNLNGMRSWAGAVAAGISRSVNLWVKYLNPGSFYRFIHIVSVKALNSWMS